MRIKKSLLKNILVLCLTTILMLVLAEFLVRAFAPQQLYNRYNTEYPEFEYSYRQTDLGLLFTPNKNYTEYGENNRLIHIRLNAQGFRGDTDFSSSPSAARVAFFGDSFMFGHGIDQSETLPARIAEIRPGYQTYNFGNPGFSFGQSLLMYLTRGKQYSPRVAIFTIFTNDILDELDPGVESKKPYFSMTADNQLALQQYPAAFDAATIEQERQAHRISWAYSGINLFLHQHSALYALLTTVLSRYPAPAPIYPDAAKAPRFAYYLKNPPAAIRQSEFTICAIAATVNAQAQANNTTRVVQVLRTQPPDCR